MRKTISVFLILLLVIFMSAGCSATSSGQNPAVSNSDLETISEIRSAVSESEQILSDIKALAQKQMEQSTTYSAEYAAATQAGTIYDANPYEQLVRDNQKKVETCLNASRSITQRLERQATSTNQQVQAVQSAAHEYFLRLNGSMNDLNVVLSFFIDECDAAAPVADFDAASYGDDQFALMQGLYDAIGKALERLNALSSCPSYMEETFNIYKQKVTVYEKMLESMYAGQANGDVLKIYSANELFARQQIIVLKYELTLLDLFDLQYQKIAGRLDSNLYTLQSELLMGCDTLLSKDTQKKEITFSYLSETPDIEITYEAIDTIYSNLYPSLDSVVNLTATSESGSKDIMIEVEIVGFSQCYQYKTVLNEQITRLMIKPVLLADLPDLSSSKDATLKIIVTDLATRQPIVQESKTIKLMSVFDYLLWDDEFGAMTDDNILAWLTPESDGVLKLRREAISILPELTDGRMETLAGYQNVLGVEEENLYLNTYMQILGLQAAMSELGVRYNWGAFSLGSNSNQRVLLPDYVLDSQSGICIETSVLLASAIQSTHMHPMIIFTPGHAQVAVETWQNSGQYFLIETTTLPFDWRSGNFSGVVRYLSSEEWAAYLQQAVEGGCGYVVDCDLVNVLGIQGIGY